MKKTLITIAVGFGLFASAAVSFAAHFTFDVPVNVSNVHPDITHVYVTCAAVRYPLTDGRFGGAELISSANGRTVPLNGRAYNGIVTIEADALVGKRPEEANGYDCYMSMASSHTGTVLRTDDIYTYYPPAPGSAPANKVQGYFPGVGR